MHATRTQYVDFGSGLHHWPFAPRDQPPQWSDRPNFNLIIFDARCACGQKIDAPGATLEPSPPQYAGARPIVQFYLVYPPHDHAEFDVSVSSTFTWFSRRSTFDALARQLKLCFDCN